MVYDNGLSPNRQQAIICTNVGLSLIGLLRKYSRHFFYQNATFFIDKMILKMLITKWRLFCLDLNVLKLNVWHFANHAIPLIFLRYIMMTSSNENIFHVTGPLCREFPPQRLVTRSFGVFFDLYLNKWLNKQSLGWSFEMPSRSLWRHCNSLPNSSHIIL